ncbi:MAG: outer membrane protein assembly factor BamA [Pseudomonadota bacterium]
MFLRSIFLVFILMISFSVNAQVVSKIIIKGNERIEDDTIKSYLDISPRVNFDNENIDQSVKKLFGSNLFQKIDISVKDSILYVSVVENPKINLVVFEGNAKIKDKDLEAEISLKPRAIYTKAKVQDDVNRIIDLYNKNGRFSAKVTPQIITLPQNRVNLIYKIQEGPVAKIGKIVFVGNNAFSDARLQSEISSKETRWYYFLSSSDQFNPSRLEYDRELLNRFYNSRGYADFKIISIITNISDNRERFYITITIDEGVKYKFGEINLESQLQSTNLSLKELRSLITTKSNDVYDVRKVEKSIDLMIKQINDLGFAFVDISPRAVLNSEKKQVDITYFIGESSRVYINHINIKGNLRTKDKVIRREFRLDEGDPYNATKITRSEKRINDLDYFEPTSIETVRTDQTNKVDLNVNVQEKSTSSLNFAGGYSTSDGPLGRIGFNETNLLGNGQYLSLSLAKAKKSLDVNLGFTEPYMFGRPLSGGFDLFSNRMDGSQNQYRPYDQKSHGSILRAGYNLTEDLIHSFYYKLARVDISNIGSNASVYIKDQEGKKTTSMIGHALSYDRRDKVVNPTEGYIITVNQEFAGVGGSTKFLRHSAVARNYYPIINDDVVLMMGVDTGIIQGIDGKKVNISDRFNLGGAESLRGFDSGGVGPRAKDQDAALGGDILYSGVAELKFPLGFGKEIGLFGSAFADAGSLYKLDVADQSGIWDSNKLRSAYGLGIGFTTPMGPIRVHYAIPMSKASFDKTKNFDITFRTDF